jgi:hypothetical protein
MSAFVFHLLPVLPRQLMPVMRRVGFVVTREGQEFLQTTRELFVIKRVFGKGRRKNRVTNAILVRFQN